MTKEPVSKPNFSPEDWESVCVYFQDSVMASTPLAKLAQNLGTKWPIRGKMECPRKYTCLTLEELKELPEFYGKGNRLSLLYTILRETQALEDPFNDMVDHFDVVIEKNNEALKNLRELAIPEDYPVHLCNFSKDTLSLCAAEDIKTVSQLVEFSQRCAKSVVVGGDFRRFLNALMHLNKTALRQYLPIREGVIGIFLPESIGQLAETLPNDQAASLIKAFHISSVNGQWTEAKILPKTTIIELIEDLKRAVKERLQLMPDQAGLLMQAVESGEAECIRFFAPLRNPDTEGLAIAIAMAAFGKKPRFGFLSRNFLSR